MLASSSMSDAESFLYYFYFSSSFKNFPMHSIQLPTNAKPFPSSRNTFDMCSIDACSISRSNNAHHGFSIVCEFWY